MRRCDEGTAAEPGTEDAGAKVRPCTGRGARGVPKIVDRPAFGYEGISGNCINGTAPCSV